MPAPPKRTTACGTLSWTTIRRPPSRIGASGTATRVPVAGQRAEHAIEHLAERRRVDIADRGDLQRVAGEHLLRIGPQIVGGDRSESMFSVPLVGRP